MRLACQLRPEGDISVVPLVRTARPVYRATEPQRAGERDVVVLVCDFRNRAEFAADHLPQDLLYVVTLFNEGVGNAIRASGGAVSVSDADGIIAIFGHDGRRDPARHAIRAAGAIEAVIADLNQRLGAERGGRLRFSVCVHAGRAAVGEIGQSDPPTLIAVGEAVDGVNELRRAAAGSNRCFAISDVVFAQAGLAAPQQHSLLLPVAGSKTVTAYLSDAAPAPSPTWTLHGEVGRRTMLRRLLAG